jgi:hypothetical protein
VTPPPEIGHEQHALAYLREQLGSDAPTVLKFAARFDQTALEREGPMSVFAFDASVGGNPSQACYVVSGRTVPNYYPAYGLPPEEIYHVHLGTRFMLVVGVGQLPLTELPASLEQEFTDQIARIAPGEPLREFRPVTAFQFSEEGQTQRHAVCRLRIAEEEVYLIGGDLPLGIYRTVELPPHIVYRLHLGNVIQQEIGE